MEPEKEQYSLMKEQIEIEIQAAHKYYDNKLYHPALRRYEDALELIHQLSPQERATTFGLESNIELRRALIFLHLDNPNRVIEICLQLRQEVTSLPQEIEFDLDHLHGTALYLAGRYQEAIIILEKVEKGFEKLFTQDSSEQTFLKAGKTLKYNALANLHLQSLNPGIAQLYSARELFLEAGSLSHVAECDLLLGELALYLHEQRSATFHIRTALSLCESAHTKIKLASCIWHYARLQRLRGNQQQAQELYQQAQKLYLDHNLQQPAFLLLLEHAQFQAQLKNYKLVEELLLEAEDLHKGFQGPYSEKLALKIKEFELHSQIPTARINIHEGYRKLIRALRDQNSSYVLHNTILHMLFLELKEGNAKYAEELVRELEAFWASIMDSTYPMAALFRARIALLQNDPQRAEKLLINGLNSLKNTDWEHIQFLHCVEFASIQYLELNSPMLAHNYFKKANAIQESDQFHFKIPFWRDIFRYFSKDSFLEYMNFIFELKHPKLMAEIIERKILFDLRTALGVDLSHRLLPSELSLAMQMKWEKLADLSKKLLQLEGSIEFCHPFDFTNDPFFHEDESDYELALEPQSSYKKYDEKTHALRTALYKQYGRAKTEVITEDTRWHSLLREPVQDYEMLTGGLDRRSAVLMFLVAEDKSYGYIFHQGKIIFSYLIPLERTELIDYIRQWKEELFSESRSTKTARKLWELIVSPILDNMPEKVTQLLIIPHDALWHLPLHLLAHGDYILWDRFVIEYAPSLTHYHYAKHIGEKRQRKRFTCFTLVVPGISGQLSDLAHLEQVGRTKKSVDDIVLSSDTVTKKKFWHNAHQANIIIIGTKLTLFEGWPTASYFELGPGNSMDYEVKITLDDVLEMQTPHADIVIFPEIKKVPHSAAVFCAEPLLYQSWLHAGAPTLLYSLWSADPVAVSLFIQKFIHYKRKQTVAQAIQNAAFSLRGSGQFSSPRDWAPLSSLGYGGALSREAIKRKFLP